MLIEWGIVSFVFVLSTEIESVASPSAVFGILIGFKGEVSRFNRSYFAYKLVFAFNSVFNFVIWCVWSAIMCWAFGSLDIKVIRRSFSRFCLSRSITESFALILATFSGTLACRTCSISYWRFWFSTSRPKINDQDAEWNCVTPVAEWAKQYCTSYR